MNANDVATKVAAFNLLRHIIDGECCNGRFRCVLYRSGTVVSLYAIKQDAGVAVVDGDRAFWTKEPS